MSYYDPHATRRSHQRKYTRKGQVIQAKLVNTPRTIESNLVPMYRQFFINNPQYGIGPPRPPSKIPIDSLVIDTLGNTGALVQSIPVPFSGYTHAQLTANAGYLQVSYTEPANTDNVYQFAVIYIKQADYFYLAPFCYWHPRSTGFNFIGNFPIPNGTYDVYYRYFTVDTYTIGTLSVISGTKKYIVSCSSCRPKSSGSTEWESVALLDSDIYSYN